MNRYASRFPPCHCFWCAKEIPSHFLHVQGKINTQSVALLSLGSEVSCFWGKFKHTFHLGCLRQNHFLSFLLVPLSIHEVAHHHSCLSRSVMHLVTGKGCKCGVEVCLRSVLCCKVNKQAKKTHRKPNLICLIRR